MTNTPNAPVAPTLLRGCSVIELRQYQMQPGRRDELITLFEREFIETQEAVGLRVLGVFRDADAPDRFVWLRGFSDMAARLTALQAFYGGPVWQQHRNAANATMIDSDNVLLLQPVVEGIPAASNGAWHALICPLAAPWTAQPLPPAATAHAAWFKTHLQPNDFPRLPVCRGAWLLALGTRAPALPDAVEARLARPPTRLRLLPTTRSPLR